MRKIREILRLHREMRIGVRAIGRSLGVSHSTVSELLSRVEAVGIAWPSELDDETLEAQLYPGNPSGAPPRPEPDWPAIHRELRRKNVTLQLLWLEYKQEHPHGYQYSQFCDLYRRWRAGLDVVLRQNYRAGEKMFVDYAGQTMPVADPATGQVRQAQVFVAVLGASGYTYAEPSWSQELPAWIGAHCRAFEFFGGVTEAVVPDNLKAGVTHPCRYEPDLNPTYQDMAAHYGTTILPARPRHPQDRAKVEEGVQVVQWRVLAALRKRTFFSLGELAAAIGQGVDGLNSKPFQKLDGSRRSLYEALDRPALRPLPSQRYELARWKKARVNIDYHVQVDRNYYSVPHCLARQELDVRVTDAVVELLHKGRRVASHRRLEGKGRYRTEKAHMPAAHREHMEWSPTRLVGWARTIGPETAKLVEAILRDKPHPEQGYRACLGLMSLGKRHGPERMEAAARRALGCGARSYRSVKSILAQGLDRVPLEQRPASPPLPGHANVRGPAYYAEGSN